MWRSKPWCPSDRTHYLTQLSNQLDSHLNGLIEGINCAENHGVYMCLPSNMVIVLTQKKKSLQLILKENPAATAMWPTSFRAASAFRIVADDKQSPKTTDYRSRIHEAV